MLPIIFATSKGLKSSSSIQLPWRSKKSFSSIKLVETGNLEDKISKNAVLASFSNFGDNKGVNICIHTSAIILEGISSGPKNLFSTYFKELSNVRNQDFGPNMSSNSFFLNSLINNKWKASCDEVVFVLKDPNFNDSFFTISFILSNLSRLYISEYSLSSYIVWYRFFNIISKPSNRLKYPSTFIELFFDFLSV